MLSKNKIKYIHSLEQKKTRKEEQVFLAEGPKLVGDLLGHFPCRFLAATSFWLQEHPGIQFAENTTAGTCHFGATTIYFKSGICPPVSLSGTG